VNLAARLLDGVLGALADKLAGALALRVEPIVAAAVERALAARADTKGGVPVDSCEHAPATERAALVFIEDSPATLRSSGVCPVLAQQLQARRDMERTVDVEGRR
jgi:hypothetical protein